jgi:hypothetical protein
MRSLNQYTRKYPEDIADSSRVAYGWLTAYMFVHHVMWH